MSGALPGRPRVPLSAPACRERGSHQAQSAQPLSAMTTIRVPVPEVRSKAAVATGNLTTAPAVGSEISIPVQYPLRARREAPALPSNHGGGNSPAGLRTNWTERLAGATFVVMGFGLHTDLEPRRSAKSCVFADPPSSHQLTLYPLWYRWTILGSYESLCVPCRPPAPGPTPP